MIRQWDKTFVLGAVFAITQSAAQAGLIGPGDIAFIGFNADGQDGFSFVALQAIDASQTVFFTDNNWNGSTLATNEGTITWTPNSTIAQGSVVTFNNTSGTLVTNIAGASTAGSLNLNEADEALWAFLGTSETNPTSFLAVVANEADGVGAPNLLGTSLTDGSTAQIIDGDNDIMIYNGPRFVDGPFSDFLSLIGDDANWVTEGSSGDQSLNGIAPDLPFDTTPFVNPEPSSFLLALIAVGMFGARRWLRHRGLSELNAN